MYEGIDKTTYNQCTILIHRSEVLIKLGSITIEDLVDCEAPSNGIEICTSMTTAILKLIYQQSD